jgi:hypothetical protein
VYLGLPATAAVADMPVGAPPPFVSALEPGSRTAREQARYGPASHDGQTVEEPLASCPDLAVKEGPPKKGS